MVRFLAGRIAWALVTLFLFVSLVFVAVNVLVPYDYATSLRFQPQMAEAIRDQLGLNDSLWDRYISLITGLVSFDLGRSFGGERVTAVVAGALPVTVLAFALGGVVAYLFGDWLGRVVAWRRGRLLSSVATTASVGLHTAFPPLLVFVLLYFAVGPLRDARQAVGLPLTRDVLWGGPVTEPQVMTLLAAAVVAALTVALLVRAQARKRGATLAGVLALPLSLLGAAMAIWALGVGPHALEILVRVEEIGAEQARNPLGAGSGTFGNLILAAFGLMLIAFGEVAMVVRAGMAQELGEQRDVTTARAKGVRDTTIRDRHVARNAILPVLSRAIIGVPYLLSGQIIIERELQLSGLSWALFDAIAYVDVPLIIGVLVVIGALVLVLRLVLEVAHAALDPRIRMAGGGA